MEELVREVKSALQDPFSEATRKEKRNLLATCLIAVTITWADLTSEEIIFFGFKIKPEDTNIILILLLVVVVYFSFVFGMYAYYDIKFWKVANGVKASPDDQSPHVDQGLTAGERAMQYLARASVNAHNQNIMDTVSPKARMAPRIRYAIDVLVPILAGLAAIISLLIAVL